MRKYKSETNYENMNSEQLKAEMLRMELYQMQFKLELAQEAHLREKNDRDREESALAYARKLKRKRVIQELEAEEKRNKKIPESEKKQAPVIRTIRDFRAFLNVD